MRTLTCTLMSMLIALASVPNSIGADGWLETGGMAAGASPSTAGRLFGDFGQSGAPRKPTAAGKRRVIDQQRADYLAIVAFDELVQRSLPAKEKLAEIDRLVANGFDVNVQSGDGQTPIRSLMDHGQVELVAPLVQRGLSVDSSTRQCSDEYWYAQSGAMMPNGLEVLSALSKAGFREQCLKTKDSVFHGFVCGVMFGAGADSFDVQRAVQAVERIAVLGFDVGARCLGKTIVEKIESDPNPENRRRLTPIATAIRRRSVK